ncbi:PEP-CTERM sorting domain-containing protein [Aphanothece sacrum]|uniref:HAF family repeat protein n=1 Tax=Aphanothece sacrum FPU1 TaxID=1920663 RepID=A0A401IHW3_APHSA|nr:PEP-CTERM sorting domain-containing protein [Aphanothece sacrum]GBF80883.1 HAF family repeat protein [Aphanothece sacrum FPU1]GBF85190.1 HAF family repeat protein [Aphanothece sacrum FPU3]
MSKKSLFQFTVIIAGAVFGGFNGATPAMAAFFTGLGDLPGGAFSSGALAVSADGSVVVGSGVTPVGENEAFRWTAESGLVGLGDLPGGNFISTSFGVSADGSVIAGVGSSVSSSTDNGSFPPLEAFRWTAETGLVPLGDLPGGNFFSFSFKVSPDGSVIVGQSSSASGLEAFRWTADTGIVGLGDLPGGLFNSVATSTSNDGSIIVGSGSSNNGVEAFIWRADTGLVGLGDLAGGDFFSRATDISTDGSIIVGRSSSANSSAGGLPISDTSGTEAFIWSADTGLVGLGDLPGGNFFSRSFAVSGDGSIVIGQSESDLGIEPFIWDKNSGIRPLRQLFVDLGLDLTGWGALEVADISNDGSTIVGFGVNPDGNIEAWVAGINDTQAVPEPSSVLGLLALGSFGIGLGLKKAKKS